VVIPGQAAKSPGLMPVVPRFEIFQLCNRPSVRAYASTPWRVAPSGNVKPWVRRPPFPTFGASDDPELRERSDSVVCPQALISRNIHPSRASGPAQEVAHPPVLAGCRVLQTFALRIPRGQIGPTFHKRRRGGLRRVGMRHCARRHSTHIGKTDSPPHPIAFPAKPVVMAPGLPLGLPCSDLIHKQ